MSIRFSQFAGPTRPAVSKPPSGPIGFAGVHTPSELESLKRFRTGLVEDYLPVEAAAQLYSHYSIYKEQYPEDLPVLCDVDGINELKALFRLAYKLSDEELELDEFGHELGWKMLDQLSSQSAKKGHPLSDPELAAELVKICVGLDFKEEPEPPFQLSEFTDLARRCYARLSEEQKPAFLQALAQKANDPPRSRLSSTADVFKQRIEVIINKLHNPELDVTV